MTDNNGRRPSRTLTPLASRGSAGQPRFDGAAFGPVLVALIEAARFYAYDDPCATLDVLAVAGTFATNISLGVSTQHARIDVDDVDLARAMLRRTAEQITIDLRDSDDFGPRDRQRATTLTAAADSLDAILAHAR